MTVKATTRFRSLLAQGKLVVAPGAFDPMSAKLVEKAGFDVVYITGSGSALAMHGLPDLELVSMGEVANTLRAVVESVTIPVLGDADTGHGNPLNVRRTTQMFERAGIAGMHMEDVATPKNGREKKELATKGAMVQKIRAAVEARVDPDFFIIARTDSLGVNGYDDTVGRARAYAEAGADMVFVEGIKTREVMRDLVAALPGVPLLFNPGTTGKLADVTVAEAEAIGYRLMFMPNFTTLAAIRAVREVLQVIKETGSPAEAYKLCATIPEMHEIAGTPVLKALQSRYFTPREE